MRLRHHERGQALIESVVFLPVLLFALGSLLFFSQLGVLDERAQMAARFGGNISYQQGQPYLIATLQDVISTVLNPSPAELGIFCTGASGPNNFVRQSAADAVTQNQGDAGSVAPTVFAGPSAAPFWHPSTTAQGSCTPTAISLQTSPSSPVLPASFTQVTVAGTVNVPAVLSYIYGGQPSAFNASWNVINVGLPTQLLLCNVPILKVLEVAVGRTGSPTATCGS